LYYFQIHAWLQHFPATQMLVLKSEDYFADPEAVVATITDFIHGTVTVRAWAQLARGIEPALSAGIAIVTSQNELPCCANNRQAWAV